MQTNTKSYNAGIAASKRRRNILLLLMISPAMGLLLVFNYVPMYGIIIAFKKYNLFLGFFDSPWVGLDNFRYFLTDATFWRVMRNTIRINLYDIAFGFSAPIIFALLVNEVANMKYKKIVQTISYMPNFLSWVVVSGLVIGLLAPTHTGLVNMALTRIFGIEPIYFMANKDMFIPVIVTADIWKNVGFSSILYFATIAGIDTSLYEAAAIDGAGRLKMARYITLPGILPMITIMLIFRVAGIFGIGFERIFLMQNNLTREVSEVISTYVYNLGIEKAQFSLTTAIGLTQSILGLFLVYSSNTAAKKLVGYSFY